MSRLPLALVGLIGLVLASTPSAQQAPTPQDLPRFTSSVEVTTLDVSAFDAQGKPVSDLKPDEFVVKVDNTSRTVVSAEWVRLELDAKAAPAVPVGYSSNQGSSGGRLVMLVVDQPNIRVGGTFGIRKAVNGFIDRLQPSDRMAVVGLGRGAASTSFTSDRNRLKKIVGQLSGMHTPLGVRLHNITVAEAIEIDRGIEMSFTRVVDRECVSGFGAVAVAPDDIEACKFEIRQESRELAMVGAFDGRQTIQTLRTLLVALRGVEGPKTMIFVSEGFLMNDLYQEVLELGTIAAAARTSIYALRLDDSLFQMAASEGRVPFSRMDDRIVRTQGMEILTGASRGSLINVMGDGSSALQRIASELAGYYLIGVESGARDRDGKAHPISVEVKRRGVSVRTRRALIAPRDAPPAPRNPREAMMAALMTPLPVAALPLRVATYSLQGPEKDRVQLLIHADVGTDYATSRVASVGYVITDADGHMVDSQASTARLPPVMTGVPSALQFSGGASLPPGEYQLKFAVAEGDRLGTVEHTIRAGTTAVGSVRLSDLMVGGPLATAADPMMPTVGYTVVFGVAHAYVEAYGETASRLAATYEVAATADGPALVSAEGPGAAVGPTRAIFTRLLPVRQLPPGKYVLRVKLKAGGSAVKTLTSGFEVGAPAVLMTSASTAPETTAREVYLPVADSVFGVKFDASRVLDADVLQSFRQRVPASQQAAFDDGVNAFRGGAYSQAEGHFKRAVTPEADSSAALAYLAATYAAGGHDTEAASAWQTSLVDGVDHPETYEWLAGALMRSHDLGLARTMLEEAVARWPSDVRFTKPMAVVYGTFGQGPQAVRSLERYLEKHPDDADALLMGVEWIYQLRSANAVAHSPADDVALARKYADAYIATSGPQAPLVKQWMEFLERK